MHFGTMRHTIHGFRQSHLPSLIALVYVGRGGEFIEDKEWSIDLARARLTSDDLIKNNFKAELRAPVNESGTLILVVRDSQSGAKRSPVSILGASEFKSGDYDISIARSEIKPGVYRIIEVEWKTTQNLSSSYDLPSRWIVHGTTRHSVYNTPVEAKCSGKSIDAYVLNNKCKSILVSLNKKFSDQLYINGTGRSIHYGTLAYVDVENKHSLCYGRYPKNRKNEPIYLMVDEIKGACGNKLGDTDQAAFPNPKKSKSGGNDLECKDKTTLVTQPSESLHSTRIVKDYCPICKKKEAGVDFHIDNYTITEECIPGKIGDLGNFWTAHIEKGDQ